MLALIVSDIVGLTNTGVAGWARVVCIIIDVLLILVVIWTIACMYSNTDAYAIGYVLCVLTVATVIVSFIYYTRLTPGTGIIPVADLNYFLFVVGNLVLINLLSIAIYITGLYIKQPKELGNTKVVR
jgi:hypothetical protein